MAGAARVSSRLPERASWVSTIKVVPGASSALAGVAASKASGRRSRLSRSTPAQLEIVGFVARLEHESCVRRPTDGDVLARSHAGPRGSLTVWTTSRPDRRIEQVLGGRAEVDGVPHGAGSGAVPGRRRPQADPLGPDGHPEAAVRPAAGPPARGSRRPWSTSITATPVLHRARRGTMKSLRVPTKSATNSVRRPLVDGSRARRPGAAARRA